MIPEGWPTEADVRCIALQHGFKYKEQPDGTMDLNPYVYSFAKELVETAKSLAAAPTSPAREAEPVGFISQSVIDGLKAGKRVQYWMLPKKNGDDFPDIDVPFYTHAPSDKLRQAVKSITDLLRNREWAEDVTSDPDITELESQITIMLGKQSGLRQAAEEAIRILRDTYADSACAKNLEDALEGKS